MPLGVVLYGYWPMGLSRLELNGLQAGQPFTSPKGEVFWTRKLGQNLWIYPGWPLDIRQQRNKLIDAGYSMLISLSESPPRGGARSRPRLQLQLGADPALGRVLLSGAAITLLLNL